MKKSLFLIFLVAILAFGLSGCNKDKTPVDVSSEPNKTPVEKDNSRLVVLNLGTQAKSWDPQKNNNTEGSHIINNIFEGLLRNTENGVEYAGMESYTLEANADGVKDTVYTFTLKKGVKWSDGKEVTAHDYAYAWVRAADPELASGSSTLVTPYVKGALDYFENNGKKEDVAVRALDDYTLQVELVTPVPYFFNLLALGVYSPVRQDMVEPIGEGWEKEVARCVSNGPFKVTEYKVGSHVIIEKNEHYYDADNVKIQGVKFLFLEELTTGLQGYQNGEIQILDQIPMEEIPKLQAEDPNFSSKASVGTYFYSFNMDKEPTNDAKVREALSIVIDRKKLINQVTRGGEMPATGFIPPIVLDSEEKPFRLIDEVGNTLPEFGIDPTKGQVEKAKQLLADAGYPNGEGMPKLDVVFNSSESNQKIAEAIQQMWKEIGVESELRSEDWAVFGKTRNSGNFSLNRGGWSSDFADPVAMLEIWTSYSPVNGAMWRWKEYAETPNDTTMNPRNKEYDELIEKIMTTNGKERDEYVRSAEKIIMEEERVCIPLYHYTNKQIVDSSLIEGAKKTQVGVWILRDIHWVD